MRADLHEFVLTVFRESTEFSKDFLHASRQRRLLHTGEKESIAGHRRRCCHSGVRVDVLMIERDAERVVVGQDEFLVAFAPVLDQSDVRRCLARDRTRTTVVRHVRRRI